MYLDEESYCVILYMQSDIYILVLYQFHMIICIIEHGRYGGNLDRNLIPKNVLFIIFTLMDIINMIFFLP